MKFQLWAPFAKRVDLELAGRRLPMRKTDDGCWALWVPEARHGLDYAYVLDNGPARPDPRSAWQPHGVHGPSRVVDHDRFRWTDAGWKPPPLSSAIIYELHIGTFTPGGTFDSAIERLDELAQLGISHVELMPVNAFSGVHGWGYDGVALFAPHDPYGGPDGLKRFVDACHSRGLAVLLDVVYNHLGPSGNYLAEFAPYFNHRYSTPWGPAINFDGAESGPVRRFICDNALMWLRDYHLDGLRLDAIHAILDTSAVHILEQLKAEVDLLEAVSGRHRAIIAESDLNDPRVLWPPERGGFGLHAQWSDDFHHALHSVLTGEQNGYYADFGQVAQLARAIQNAYVYAGEFSPYRRRRHGRPPDGLSGHRFLAYLQNHDQIGNRACGERSGQLMSSAQLKIGAALVLTSPFIPMLFQGEEWAASTPFLYFTDHPEPDLGKAVSEGRRREFAAFGWDPEDIADPQDRRSFERSKLNWNERKRGQHRALLDWHKQLIKLRRSTPDLLDGKLHRVQVQWDEAARWLSMRRGSIQVICNFASRSQRVPVQPGGNLKLRLGSDEKVRVGRSSVLLGAESVAIFSVVEPSAPPKRGGREAGSHS